MFDALSSIFRPLSEPAITLIVIVLIVAAVMSAYLIYRKAAAKRSSLDRPRRQDTRPAPGSPASPAINHEQTAASNAGPAADLAEAANWCYQLQDFDLAKALASPFDLLVIDPTFDGNDDSALTVQQIRALQQKPDGSRRIVLAYLSIGEAESYRNYWRSNWSKARSKPDWLLGENPDWDENYSVKFWHEDWQTIIFGSHDSCLDKIMAQGFDGVYLDKCDVYEDLQRRYKKIARSRPDLPRDMIAFIGTLSEHARAAKPDFQIVMQNGEELLEHRELRAVINGVAKEELVFGREGLEARNDDDEFEYSRHLLELARSDGLPVFVVEYLRSKSKITQAAKLMSELGFVLAISDPNRELARLGTIPPAPSIPRKPAAPPSA